jgi:hypothetical protein
MIGAPPTKADEAEQVYAIIEAVDRVGKDMDAKWGLGRLPTLVSPDWAQKFASQKRKMHDACWSWNVAETLKHGEAMIRAYRKLDELATAAGHRPGPAEQWEFEGPDGLIVLVCDRERMNQVETGGRRCQVWSLDEVAEVIRKHPTITVAKDCFPGAEVVSIRPVQQFKTELNDSLEGLPF